MEKSLQKLIESADKTIRRIQIENEISKLVHDLNKHERFLRREQHQVLFLEEELKKLHNEIKSLI